MKLLTRWTGNVFSLTLNPSPAGRGKPAVAAARYNPVLCPGYERLCAKGKPAFVALICKFLNLAKLFPKNPKLGVAHKR